MKNRLSVHDRFWGKVSKASANGCWVWQAGRSKDGYGKIRINGKSWIAHRYAWTSENGDIPDGMCICHHCDNPPCVNPSHLFLGTKKENTADMWRKGRARRDGEHNAAHKLSCRDVLEIKRLLRSRTKRYLSEEFGVSVTAIQNIAIGKKWGHLTGIIFRGTQ